MEGLDGSSYDVEAGVRRDNVTDDGDRRDVREDGARGDVRDRSIGSFLEVAVTFFTWLWTCCGRRVPGAAASPLLDPLIADVPSPVDTTEAATDPNLPHRFLTWVRVFFCGSASDAGDEAALLHGFGNWFGGDDEAPPSLATGNAAVPTAATGEIVVPPLATGNAAVPTPATDSIVVPPVGWSGFLEDANTFIQWMLSTVFLFVPAKLLVAFAKLLVALWTETTLPSTVISDFLDEVVKSYFPEIFLPSILLYAGFFMGAKIFKNPTLKFYFEVISVIIGVGATMVMLFFLGAEEWRWTFGALVVFSIILGVCKLWDYFH